MMRLRSLLGRPIVVHQVLIDLVDRNIAYAVFLGQLLYWSESTNAQARNGWFYKSQAEWEEETRLRRRVQENARKYLVDLGLLEEKLEGLPAKLWYRLNVDRLEELLRQAADPQYVRHVHTSMDATDDKDVRHVQTYNTEITPKTTAPDDVHSPDAHAHENIAPGKLTVDVSRNGGLAGLRFIFMGRKPPTKAGSVAPDRVIVTEDGYQWARDQGWRASMKALQASADGCLTYFRGEGKRKADWQAVVENWIARDILDGVDVRRAQAEGIADNTPGTAPGTEPGRTGNGRTNGRTGYGYNAQGEPTNRAAQIRTAAERLAERQRERRRELELGGHPGSDVIELGPDDWSSD